MPALTVEVLLEQARGGVKLEAEQRRRCIAHLMANEAMSNVELGELFGVSEKTIREDKVKIREDVSEEMDTRDINLVVADLKMSFQSQLIALQKGQKAAEVGSKNHLEYTKAITALEVQRVKLFQELGVLPTNVGASQESEFMFKATVTKGDSVKVERIREFETRVGESRLKAIPATAKEQIIDIPPAEERRALISVTRTN